MFCFVINKVEMYPWATQGGYSLKVKVTASFRYNCFHTYYKSPVSTCIKRLFIQM